LGSWTQIRPASGTLQHRACCCRYIGSFAPSASLRCRLGPAESFAPEQGPNRPPSLEGQGRVYQALVVLGDF